MISTTELVMIAFLILILGTAIFWLVVALKYRSTLTNFSYARGANLLIKSSPKGSGEIKLECDSDREICVWRATAICSGVTNDNHEISINDPISDGGEKNSPYGDFNIKSTNDITTKLVKLANGKTNYIFNFNENGSDIDCDVINPTQKGSTFPQLIATYSCIPKGTTCKSYSEKNKM